MSKNFNPEEIKTDFEKEEIILGIDEAGRGPTLGPMVYACAYWSKNNDENIKSYFGFDDSKKLSREKREKLYIQIEKYNNIIKYEKIIISAEEISSKMLKRRKISLNEISQEAAFKLILTSKRKGVNIKYIRVDTVGPAQKYENYLKKLINDESINIKVESKADAKYPCVSAASIVAKVTRDNIVDNWEFDDKNTGSGYPSDPYTKAWLQRNFNNVFGYPNFIRFSWKTVSHIFKEKNYECQWENYNEAEELEKEKQLKNKFKKDNKHTLDNENQNNVIDKKSNCNINENFKIENLIPQNFYQYSNISLEADL